MDLIEIAVPVAKRQVRIHVDKGFSWSLIEHLLLDAIVRQVVTVGELERGLGLSPQVLSAALRHLARVHWIELYRDHEGDEISLLATPAGKAAAACDELHHPGRRIIRPATYFYDLVVGHVFKPSELRVVDAQDIESLGPEHVLRMSPRLSIAEYRCHEIPDAILERDERLHQFDRVDRTWGNKFALFTVERGVVRRIPPRARDLQEAILSHAAETANASCIAGVPCRGDIETQHRRPMFEISFDPDQDLVIGGDAHKRAIEEAIDGAEERMIVHSTFLNDLNQRAFRPIFDKMKAAAEGGVKVDVLWGQDDDEVRPERDSALAIRRIRDELERWPYRDNLTFHSHTTGSHAKFLIVDPELPERCYAVVGSCNWLASGFGKFEVSARLRSPAVVREILSCVIDLVQSHTSVSTQLAMDLFKLRRSLGTLPSERGGAKAQIVIGQEHHDAVLRASVEAQRRIVVISHRMGAVARPGALLPLAQACRSGPVKARVYFGHKQGKEYATQWSRDPDAQSVPIEYVEYPPTHAKVLAWDDDSAVISSLNWLSADPKEFNLARELGVYIQAKDVVKRIVERFEELRSGFLPAHRRG